MKVEVATCHHDPLDSRQRVGCVMCLKMEMDRREEAAFRAVYEAARRSLASGVPLADEDKAWSYYRAFHKDRP